MEVMKWVLLIFVFSRKVKLNVRIKIQNSCYHVQRKIAGKFFPLGYCRYENPPVLAFPLQAQKHDSQPAKAYGCPRYNVSKPLHGGKRQKIDAGPSQNYRG